MSLSRAPEFSRSTRAPIGRIALIVALGLAACGGTAFYFFGPSTGRSAAATARASQQKILARKLLELGDAEKALAALAPLSADGRALDEDAALLRMRAWRVTGNHASLVPAATEFIASHPQSPYRAEVQALQLVSEISRGGLSTPALRKQAEAFVAAATPSPERAEVQLALGKAQLAAGDRAGAKASLEAALSDSKSRPELETEVADQLGAVNYALLMSGPRAGDDTYKIKKGDSMARVAKRAGISTELLLAANRETVTDHRKLRIGQELRVPRSEFSLLCDVEANTLTVLDGGKFFKRYTVRTGREAGTTPPGEFKILNKKTNPTWRPGDGRVYPGGDVNNELGTRWMSFQADILGIHGTIHPETVGEYASNGCIGMKTEDVEELFDLVQVGTPLRVTGTQDLRRHKVIAAHDVPPPGEKTIASVR